MGSFDIKHMGKWVDFGTNAWFVNRNGSRVSFSLKLFVLKLEKHKANKDFIWYSNKVAKPIFWQFLLQ